MTTKQERNPRNAIGEMCTCGHPQICHCAAGHINKNGDIIALVTGHGSCLACENELLEAKKKGLNPDPDDPKYCSKFTFSHFIYKGDKEYKKFKHLYKEQ